MRVQYALTTAFALLLFYVAFEALNRLPAPNTVPVVTGTAGIAAAVYHHQGETIHTGDPLLQLDTRAVDARERALQVGIHQLESSMRLRSDQRQELRQLYAELEAAELNRTRLTVTSPVDGVIISVVPFQCGDVVKADSIIATIEPTKAKGLTGGEPVRP